MSQEQFAKAAIKRQLKVEDPEVYEKLVDIIYKFSMVILYGDNMLRRQAIDALFSVLPEDLVLQVLSDYVVRTMNRYRKLAEIAMSGAAGREDQEGQAGGDIDNGARGRGERPKVEAQRSHQ